MSVGFENEHRVDGPFPMRVSVCHVKIAIVQYLARKFISAISARR